MLKPSARTPGPPKAVDITSAAHVQSAGPPLAKSIDPAKSHTDVTSNDTGG